MGLSGPVRTVACLWAVLCAGTEVVVAGSDEMLEISGIVRDFRERTVDGGHPDFELIPLEGYRLYTGNVAPFLDDNGKPVFTGEGVGLRKSWQEANFAALQKTGARARRVVFLAQAERGAETACLHVESFALVLEHAVEVSDPVAGELAEVTTHEDRDPFIGLEDGV